MVSVHPKPFEEDSFYPYFLAWAQELGYQADNIEEYLLEDNGLATCRATLTLKNRKFFTRMALRETLIPENNPYTRLSMYGCIDKN